MTRDNTAVLLIDYQIGLLTDVRDVRVAKLTNNVVSLANSAVELGLPIVAITTACDALGPAMSELKYVLGRAQIMDRSTVNPWDYPPFVAAVTVTRRTHLIMAGLGFEVGVTLLAISARAHGYQPAVAIDACGTFTTKDRQSGIERLTALDVEVCDYAVLFSEITAGEKADK